MPRCAYLNPALIAQSICSLSINFMWTGSSESVNETSMEDILIWVAELYWHHFNLCTFEGRILGNYQSWEGLRAWLCITEELELDDSSAKEDLLWAKDTSTLFPDWQSSDIWGIVSIEGSILTGI